MNMKRRLLLAIDETWTVEDSCQWALVDEEGRFLESGVGTAARWPVADDCGLLLCGALVTWLEVRIPAGVHREEAALVRDQLEAMVLEIETQHCVRTHRTADTDSRLNRVGTLLVAKGRLRDVIDGFNQLDRPLGAVWAEVQTAGLSETLPALFVSERGLLVRPSAFEGFAVDSDYPEQMLAETLPPGSRLYVSSSRRSNNAWRDSAGTAMIESGAYDWWKSLTDPRACNLLQGEFATAKQTNSDDRTYWQKPVVWSVVLVTLWLALGWGELMFHRVQLSRQSAEIATIFAGAMPGIPMVSPVIQLGRSLEEARSRRGLLRDDDFLVLLNVVSPMLPEGVLQSLAYAEGRLTLQLPPDFSPEAWHSKLEPHGLEIRQLDAETNRWSIGPRRPV